MNRLRAALQQQSAAGRKGLLPYVTAGYPDLAATVAVLRALDQRYCLCAEIGIPFSDPIADGPVIQASFSRALESGFKLDDLLATVARHRDQIAVPLVAMLSYSIVYRRRPATFVQQARAAGFDGLIVPDLALEEADELAALGRTHDCPLILMAAPTSDPPRRRRIAAISDPFIYYQSVAGVTGERAALPADLTAQVQTLKAESGLPVCVGFGIARPQQVAAVCAVADGAIVGSAIVRRITAAIAAGGKAHELAATVRAFLDELAHGLPGEPTQ